MDYAEAQAAFFTPRPHDDPPPATDAWGSPARRLRDAVERIALVDLWSQQGFEALDAIGLDFLGGYAWGRGSALGEAHPAVVASAFAVFEPGLVAALLESARATATADDVRAAKLTGAIGALRAVIGEPDDVLDVVTALRRGIGAADTAGRPLFAGLSSLPWPDERLGQLWHAVNMLRELRGDSHIAACVAAGVDGIGMNVLTELWIGWEPRAYSATRGWSDDALDASYAALAERGWLDGVRLTAAGRRARDEIETRTDRAMAAVIEAIGVDLDLVVARCAEWGEALVVAGAVPPDPYKAAAG